MSIERFGSGGPWEERIGYSRVVRAGDLVLVSGCTATGPDGNLVGVGDVHAQATQAIANIEAALAKAGATLADVVRTRMYLTDISQWEDAGRAHGEAFAAHRPVTTMVEVPALIGADMLVEIEAEAYLPRA